MYHAVGVLIPKPHLRNSELFPSYSKAWLLQKKRERRFFSEMVWKLSRTKRSNSTPLVHTNLKWPEWLQVSHFQLAPTYLALEFCFSAIFISCVSSLCWYFKRRDGITHLQHPALYLQPEHTCCCPPVKRNKLLNKYVLKPKCVVQHLRARAAQITDEVRRW